jgi:hypothetical protein
MARKLSPGTQNTRSTPWVNSASTTRRAPVVCGTADDMRRNLPRLVGRWPLGQVFVAYLACARLGSLRVRGGWVLLAASVDGVLLAASVGLGLVRCCSRRVWG